METQDTSTGNFDQAFSESVIDSFDFDFPPPSGGHVNWFCIDGGTTLLGEAMKSSIKGKIDLRKRVTSISINRSIPIFSSNAPTTYRETHTCLSSTQQA